MSYYGPSWPLKKGTEDLFEMNDSLRKQVNFFLRNLLLTSPGENISDPDYGVGLRRFLFESYDSPSLGLLRARIFDQISKYLNYLSVSDVVIGTTDADMESNSMTLKIIYSYRNIIINESFILEMNPEQQIGLS